MPQSEPSAYRQELEAEARGDSKAKVVKGRGNATRFAFQNALYRSGWLAYLKPSEIKVAFVLNVLANNELKVRIGHSAIGAATGMRRENVARTTKGLERKGIIRCTHRGRTLGQSGKREANEYQLLSKLPQCICGASTTIGATQ